VNYSVSADALKSKVILVTGAGNGIGRQAALSYAEHGATVILLGRNVQNLESIYDEIEAAGYPQAAIIPLDLKGATQQNYIDMAETIEGQFGRLDGLLHNAGVLSSLCPFDQIKEEDFDAVSELNLRAALFLAQAVAKNLIAAELPGSIINIFAGIPAPTKPLCAGSWPDPPPETMATCPGSASGRITTRVWG